MESGKLRNKVTVQNATTSQDGMNEQIESWSNGNTWHCSIKPISDTEGERETAINTVARYELRGRYDSTITTESRLIFGSRTFHIEQVLNTGERDRELRLIVREQL